MRVYLCFVLAALAMPLSAADFVLVSQDVPPAPIVVSKDAPPRTREVADVLAYLEQNPGSFSLRGHTVEATLFFSDVEGFTSISEGWDPERVVNLMNAYLTPVTNAIMDSGGYVDKYVGDEVMAVWGAPYPDADHARRACRCALAQQELLARLNERLQEQFGVRLRVRMALHSGPVTAGNMGSERKLQYTVMGDVVNLASRLEPVNKDFGTTILVSGATRELAGDAIVARRLGRLVVVGRFAPVDIYELQAVAGAVEPARLEANARYEEALARLEARDWDGCLKVLQDMPERWCDGAVRFLRRQALRYQREAPPADWRGEYVRIEKG